MSHHPPIPEPTTVAASTGISPWLIGLGLLVAVIVVYAVWKVKNK